MKPGVCRTSTSGIHGQLLLLLRHLGLQLVELGAHAPLLLADGALLGAAHLRPHLQAEPPRHDAGGPPAATATLAGAPAQLLDLLPHARALLLQLGQPHPHVVHADLQDLVLSDRRRPAPRLTGRRDAAPQRPGAFEVVGDQEAPCNRGS